MSKSYSEMSAESIARVEPISGPIAIDNCLISWYVLTSTTSWINVEKIVVSGPYTTKEQALEMCIDGTLWPELLSTNEANKMTY